MGLFIQARKAEMVINENDTDDVVELIYTTIISKTGTSLGKGSDQNVCSVIDHKISISKYNLLAESSYVEFRKEFIHKRA